MPALARGVPEVLLLPRAPLPEARNSRLTSLIENHVESAQLYHECSERHEALAALVRTMQRHTAQQVTQPASRARGHHAPPQEPR